jgi:hypothetical protein
VAGQQRDMAGREVPLAEAATILGTTQEAVRKRLRRGSLLGGKHGGEWCVVLPPELDPRSNGAGHGGTERDTAPADGGTEEDPRRDTAGQAAVLEARLQEVERHRDALAAQLAEQNAHLTACLERLREAHVLLAQERALPAPSIPDPEMGAVPINDLSEPRPWWARLAAWWRR